MSLQVARQAPLDRRGGGNMDSWRKAGRDVSDGRERSSGEMAAIRCAIVFVSRGAARRWVRGLPRWSEKSVIVRVATTPVRRRFSMPWGWPRQPSVAHLDSIGVVVLGPEGAIACSARGMRQLAVPPDRFQRNTVGVPSRRIFRKVCDEAAESRVAVSRLAGR